MIFRRSLPDIAVFAPPISMDPVSWVQRYEVFHLVRELEAKGWDVERFVYRRAGQLLNLNSTRLLRLSDNLMVHVTADLSAQGIAYAGPSALVLSECYDKQNAYRLAAECGIPCPETIPTKEYRYQFRPALVKPRHGSDSLGIRILRDGRIPNRFKERECLVQPFLFAEELTIGILPGYIGIPLRILRPEGKVYSFFRKNLQNTPRVRVNEETLGRRIVQIAERVLKIFRVDWAARVDMLYDRKNDQIYFLECDASPLIGATSSLSESLALAGVSRDEQLRFLLKERSRE